MQQLIGEADELGGTLDRAFAVSPEGVATMQSATEAVRNFDAGLEQLANQWKRVSDVADPAAASLAASMHDLVAAANDTSGALDRVFAVSSGGVASQLSLAEATQQVVDALHAEALAEVELHTAQAFTAADMAALNNALKNTVIGADGITRSLDGTVGAMLGLTDDTGKADAAVTTIAGTFAKSVAGINVFGIGWTGLHWIIMGTFDALSTILPALTALGAGLAAGAEGAQWIADKMQGVYTASEATSQMLHTTAGEALGLKSTLQQAQTAADPGVYELLGGALNGLSQPLANGKTLFQGFAAEGVQVIHMIDAFVAKVDVELRGSLGTQLSSVLGNGVHDLQMWGQVLGNLTHTITNIATAAPGLSQVLLELLSVVTKFLEILTSNQGLLTFVMILEEAYRWGGLASSVLSILVSTIGNVVGGIGKLAGSLALMGDVSKFTDLRVALMGVDAEAAVTATKLEGIATFLTGPWGWAVAAAAAGLGFIVYKMVTAQTAAQQWASSMESAINKASPAQGLTNILTDLPKLQNVFRGYHRPPRAAPDRWRQWQAGMATWLTRRSRPPPHREPIRRQAPR